MWQKTTPACPRGQQADAALPAEAAEAEPHADGAAGDMADSLLPGSERPQGVKNGAAWSLHHAVCRAAGQPVPLVVCSTLQAGQAPTSKLMRADQRPKALHRPSAPTTEAPTMSTPPRPRAARLCTSTSRQDGLWGRVPSAQAM